MIVNQDVVSEAPLPAAPAAQSKMAIVAHNVGKMYRIYERPQDRLKQMLWRGRRLYGHEFWALRNISFEVKHGETVGIIGRNGSGKSTLLQIIAGTLAPTEGTVQVSGRVAALLELGSGFNPEFTGRENVFLNAAILGISREQIEQRFDDIAAFADIGAFIDQPVKMYSSGMMLRLAFAVQIHVDADVLIVDEALAVGDIFFQARCSRALQQFQDNGGTLLFVSHDMLSVERLCSRGLLLDGGTNAFWGDVAQAVHMYYYLERNVASHPEQHPAAEQAANDSHIPAALQAVAAIEPLPIRRQSATSTGAAYIETLYITDDAGRATTKFGINQWMHVYVIARFDEDINGVDFGAGLCDRSAVLLGGAHSWYPPGQDRAVDVRAGERLLFHVKLRLAVAPGEYLLLTGLARNFSMSIWEDLYVLLDACTIQVSGAPQFWGQHQMDSVIFDAERL